MYTHIAVVEFDDDVTDEAIMALAVDIKALPEVIPGVLSISVGIVPSANGSRRKLGLSSQFATLEELQYYNQHPSHLAIGARINAIASAKVGADFTSD